MKLTHGSEQRMDKWSEGFERGKGVYNGVR